MASFRAEEKSACILLVSPSNWSCRSLNRACMISIDLPASSTPLYRCPEVESSMSMTRRLFLLFAVFLISQAAPAEARTALDAATDQRFQTAFQGKTLEELIDVYGMPSRRTAITDGKRIVEYNARVH